MYLSSGLELFLYDSQLGLLTFKEARGSSNRGDVAGYTDPDGYVKVRVDSVLYKLHSLVWLIETGEWVPGLDHWDGNPSNNRFGNLRVCTQAQNAANAKLKSNNTTGYTGVSYCKGNGKYCAKIMVKGKMINLGYHATAAEAGRVRNEVAERLLGEFASHLRPK